MTECDSIISSPSTFCICAGFIGKNKYIIHSAKWAKDRADKRDKFWSGILQGGNFNYPIGVLV